MFGSAFGKGVCATRRKLGKKAARDGGEDLLRGPV